MHSSRRFGGLVAKNPFDNVVLPKAEYKKLDI